MMGFRAVLYCQENRRRILTGDAAVKHDLCVFEVLWAYGKSAVDRVWVGVVRGIEQEQVFLGRVRHAGK
jgi:hypothetical protein